jgi:hypothetical protein
MMLAKKKRSNGILNKPSDEHLGYCYIYVNKLHAFHLGYLPFPNICYSYVMTRWLPVLTLFQKHILYPLSLPRLLPDFTVCMSNTAVVL